VSWIGTSQGCRQSAHCGVTKAAIASRPIGSIAYPCRPGLSAHKLDTGSGPNVRAQRPFAVLTRHSAKGAKCWSGRWESDPRHTAWEAVVLPLNYARKGSLLLVVFRPMSKSRGMPPRLSSENSFIPARYSHIVWSRKIRPSQCSGSEG
jgi:hypothetical protein